MAKSGEWCGLLTKIRTTWQLLHSQRKLCVVSLNLFQYSKHYVKKKAPQQALKLLFSNRLFQGANTTILWKNRKE